MLFSRDFRVAARVVSLPTGRQRAQVSPDLLITRQCVEIERFADRALLHKDKALAALPQDVNVVRLVGMQA